MILNNVEIHNAGAIESIPGYAGDAMVRIPSEVRNKMNERARFVAMDSVGCEIRFVTDAVNVDIYLSCTKPEFFDLSQIRLFRGNFECASEEIESGRIHNIRLIEPDSFKSADGTKLQLEGFAPNVWRVCMNRGGTFVLHGIDAHGHDLRPPVADEKPRVNWLAYGSSITNSSLDGYPHIAARILKIDVQNKGLSGSCVAEKTVADWLAEESGWDIITCELGINMRGSFSPEEFRDRVDYLLRKLTTAHPDKLVVAINIFPNAMTRDWVDNKKMDSIATQRECAYNQSVREVVKEINSPNLHFFDGCDILSDFTGLSGDLLHPSSFGHAIMGMNLAEKLRKLM